MLWLELQGLKCLNPSCPDSSDRSPLKLSSRHWQLETALLTTSLFILSQQRAHCTNIHHDNCCHPLDKKSPVPVNHGRPSKSNVGDSSMMHPCWYKVNAVHKANCCQLEYHTLTLCANLCLILLFVPTCTCSFSSNCTFCTHYNPLHLNVPIMLTCTLLNLCP